MFTVCRTVCLLRRSLPGLGFAFTFVGIILQLLHDLNKNVYTVNPEHVFRCGLSREDGLFLIGQEMHQLMTTCS